MLYAKKLVRDLLRQKGQALAVLVVTALGVFLFVASAAGYRDLESSYADTRARLALADLHVTVPAVSSAELASVRATPGVATAEARVVTALPVVAPRGGSRVELRVLSLPERGAPALDKVLLISGALPTGPDEVLLEKHFALHQGLAQGDELTLASTGITRRLRVSGVAVSAEYLWVARDESDLFPSLDAFGVGWMRRDALRSVAKALESASPESAAGLVGVDVAGSDLEGNQVLVERAAGARSSEVLEDVEGALGGREHVRAVAAADLPGIRLLQMDVDGYEGMAAFFPIFFLGVGAFIVASILSRLVDAQRAVIGTWMALGVRRSRILTHYLAYALSLGVTGSVIGATLGVFAGRALTHQYAEELGIPFVTARLHGDLALTGLGMGVAASLVAAWIPAFRASRLAPAEAMLPPRPSMGFLSKLSRHLRAPLAVRLALRDLLGRPLRTLGTALGVASALVLVLSTGAMLDSMRVTTKTLFEGAQRFDDRVDWAAPMPEREALERVRALDATERAEPLVTVGVRLTADHDHAEDASLQGLPDDATLVRSMDATGELVPPAPGKIVLSRSMASKLGVRIGDVVHARALPAGPEATFEVGGLGDAVMGPVASARIASVREAFHLDGLVTSVVVLAKPGRAAALHDEISKLPTAAHVLDLAALRAEVDQMMGLGWLMLGTMLFFGVVLATAILFNTATLDIVERRREMATLRALGRSMREIALGLTLEHGILATLGLALGLPLAVVATKRILALYSSDLFALPFVMSPSTVVVAAAGVVAVLLLAQWPALRDAARTPLADAVRTREG